jgi:hypothetical protein
MTDNEDQFIESIKSINTDNKTINIYNYWGDIIAGKINLENGKKYDSLSFYNPKLLKYSIKDIKRSLKVHAFYHTAMRTKNRDYVINSGIGGSYVLLSNFDSKVKTEIANPTRKYLEESKKLEAIGQKKKIKEILKAAKILGDTKLLKLQKTNIDRMKKLGKEWEAIKKKIDKFELDINMDNENFVEQPLLSSSSEKKVISFFEKVKDYFLENWLIIIMATVMIVASLMH